MGLILSIAGSIYTSTTRLIELTDAWQNFKTVSGKFYQFLQNAICFALLYSGFV